MKKLRIDIDNTICVVPESQDFTKATPVTERIEIINELYDSGEYKIIYWSSRAKKNDSVVQKLTEKQLNSWGAKFHKLKLGKPKYHLLVDNHCCFSNWFFQDPEESLTRDPDDMEIDKV